MVASAKEQVVEVEVCAPKSRNLFFRPAGKLIRGRVDILTPTTPAELHIRNTWPEPIPGQVLGVNLTTGKKYIRDPLHDAEHASAKRRIEKRGLQLPPERTECDSHSVKTWVHFMHSAVSAGQARVISGTLPAVDSLEGEVERDFIFARPKQSATDRLAVAMDRMADAFTANTQIMARLLDRLKAD